MKIIHAISATALILTSGAAMAQQNTFKLGIANVRPHSDASDIRGPFTPPGLSLRVEDISTPVFGYVRELDEKWDFEFALGVPPTHDVSIKVSPALPASVRAFDGRVGARVRQVAPTVFANYKFLEKSSAWRPFVGLGLNYTKFDKAVSTSDGNAINGGPTSLSLKDSFGLALQAGVSYRLTRDWSLNAALQTAQVKTKLTTTSVTAGGLIVREADIRFRPEVLSLTVGYSF